MAQTHSAEFRQFARVAILQKSSDSSAVLEDTPSLACTIRLRFQAPEAVRNMR